MKKKDPKFNIYPNERQLKYKSHKLLGTLLGKPSIKLAFNYHNYWKNNMGISSEIKYVVTQKYG